MADISGKDLAYRALASALGGPVDLATMAMRPFGYAVEKPVLGSEWIGQRMEQGGLISEARDPLKEFAASIAVPSPGGLAAGLGKGAAMIPALAGMTKMGKVEDALGKMMKASGPDKLIPIKEVFSLPITDLPMASFLKGSKPKDAIVPVKKIAPTQSEIHSEGLLEKLMDQAEGASLKDARTGTYPEAVKMGDEYILLDGHHRIAAQIAQGKENVPVHVIGEIAPSKIPALAGMTKMGKVEDVVPIASKAASFRSGVGVAETLEDALITGSSAAEKQALAQAFPQFMRKDAHVYRVIEIPEDTAKKIIKGPLYAEVEPGIYDVSPAAAKALEEYFLRNQSRMASASKSYSGVSNFLAGENGFSPGSLQIVFEAKGDVYDILDLAKQRNIDQRLISRSSNVGEVLLDKAKSVTVFEIVNAPKSMNP